MRILIFGRGRVGGSFKVFAESLGHEALSLGRNDEARAESAIGAAGLVAAAIPDDALPPWWDQWRGRLEGKPAMHFSGARVLDGLPGYHPLYSFPAAPLDPPIFGKIAIARAPGAKAFADIVPGAANPEFVVKDEDRAFYHALAVVSGNFAAHLWNETARAFSDRLGPGGGEVLGAYFNSVVARFQESPVSSLTGPVARRDTATVEANLKALDHAPRLKALYSAFLESAWPERGPERGPEQGVDRP
ncbi:MAG: DUF2520 domain-containing protein [Parvularculaceae bacterium]|nr:DUF2520 domain-containing protein [Parvularculaceae bacterium]